MIAQTPLVIIGEAVAAGLVVGFATWIARKLIQQDAPALPSFNARTSGTHSPVVAVDSATNSPIAVGTIVHQSNVYHPPAGIATPKPAADCDSNPTPAEVSTFYKQLNPYQRTVSSAHHQGIPVHWRLVYNDISHGPDEAGDVRIASRSPAPDYFREVWVHFSININEHPRFKIAHKGQAFWLDGTIDTATAGFVEVVCCGITWESPETSEGN